MADADSEAATTGAAPAKTVGGLRARVLSALLFVPGALILVWLGGWLFVAALMAAALVMLREWNRMTLGGGKTPLASVDGVALILALALAGAGMTVQALAVVAVAAVVAAMAAAVTAGGQGWGSVRVSSGPAVVRAVALPYLGPPLIALVWLRSHGAGELAGMAAIFWLLALIWLCDTAAYFAGRALGGPRLAPGISPNKTWSGAIAGALAGGAVAVAAARWQGLGGMAAMAAAGILLAAWSQLGDLAESYIKRRFGVKDSGTLIPGHGGLLDRLDSLLFAAPALAVVVYWLA